MESLISWLAEPLGYGFMTRGLFTVILVGILCAVIGSYVVLRGMAFFGDAIAHSILPGVALGYLVHGGVRDLLFWWALGTAVVVSLGIGLLQQKARIKEDTAIGIIFAGMFALGIAILSTIRDSTMDLSHFLFGDLLGISSSNLIWISVFGILVLLIILVFFKEFLVLFFDPNLAATLRLPIGFLNNLFLVLLAITVAVAMQMVGVILTVAMLITPAATAFLLVRRLPAMMILAAAIGSVSGVIGLYASYYLNIASGSAVVLAATIFFLIAFLFSPRRGWLRRLFSAPSGK